MVHFWKALGTRVSKIGCPKKTFFLNFSLNYWKKHTLKIPLCIIFMPKKPCSKVQNLQQKFLDWKWPPPPLELFQKFIRFGRGRLPLVFSLWIVHDIFDLCMISLICARYLSGIRRARILSTGWRRCASNQLRAPRCSTFATFNIM